MLPGTLPTCLDTMPAPLNAMPAVALLPPALVAMLIFLLAGGHALADPRFEEVPPFWSDDAELTFEVLERDEYLGEIVRMRVSWPAPAENARFREFELHRGEDWQATIPRDEVEVVLHYPEALEGTWTLQPTLEILRPVGEPLTQEVEAERPPEPPEVPDREASILGVYEGDAFKELGVGDDIMRLFIDSDGAGRIWADPGDVQGESIFDVPGDESLVPPAGSGQLGIAAPGSLSGRSGSMHGGSGGYGSIGGVEVDPFLFYRFHARPDAIVLAGPTPPHVEDVAHSLVTRTRRTLPECTAELGEPRPIDWEVRVVAPPEVAAEVHLRPLSEDVPEAFTACLSRILTALPWPIPGYGWQASMQVRTSTDP